MADPTTPPPAGAPVPPASPPVQPPPATDRPPEQRPQGWAIAALILGIASVILPCLGDLGWLALPCAIAAIIVGWLTLGKIDRGEQGGRGMAIAGIVLGAIALVLGILMVLVAAGLLAGAAFMSDQWGEQINTYDLQPTTPAPGPPIDPSNPTTPTPAPTPGEPMGMLRDSAQMLWVYARAMLA